MGILIGLILFVDAEIDSSIELAIVLNDMLSAQEAYW